MNQYFISRKACPCCQSDIINELYRERYDQIPISEYLKTFYKNQGNVEFDYLIDQEYILVECQNCGLIYQKEIPNNSLMCKIYEEWIDPQKAFELFELNRNISYFSSLGSEIVQIVRFLNKLPNQLCFLDYSMGWGHWCRIARAYGCCVHGTEYSQSRINYAKKTGINVIDSEDISKYLYDYINVEQVFEHLPEPLQVLSQLIKSMKPNGILKISVPNGREIKNLLNNPDWTTPINLKLSLNPVAPLEHINCFSRESLITLLKKQGLELINIDDSYKGNNMLLKLNFQIKTMKKIILNILNPEMKYVNETRLFFQKK